MSDDINDQCKMNFIVNEFNLNKDQTLAFQIIAEHSINYEKFGSQLRMRIFEEEETEKSKLIEVI